MSRYDGLAHWLAFDLATTRLRDPRWQEWRRLTALVRLQEFTRFRVLTERPRLFAVTGV